MDSDDAAPAKLPTAGPKRPRQLEDLSSSCHPPQRERLIYIDVIKHDDSPTPAKKGTPAPERVGGSSPHPPPQHLTSPAMNGDGAPPAKRCKISIGRPPERLTADMNCDGAPPAKKRKNSSTAFTKALSRLEDLPDDLAVDILLRLTTADAARVSSLSRRCRKIRSLLPILDFNCNRCPPCVGSISASLAAHDRAAEIRYLSVTLAHMADSVSSLFRHAARLVTGELCFRSLYSAQGDELDAMLDRAWRKDQCSVDMPCFDRASRISLRLGFLSLKMPRDGCFANVKVLQLASFGYRDKFVLSMMMFPVLEELSLKRTFGFYILDIKSNSLKSIKLCKIIGLNCLMIMAPNLKVLNVLKCLEHVLRPMAEINAPKLEVFRWSAPYHPLLTSLSEMESLKLLNPPVITAFGPEEFTTNVNCVNMLRKFPALEHLELDIEVVAYNFGMHTLMQNINFPKSEVLSLHVKTSGHLSGASILHAVQMCSSIKVLNLTMEDLTHAQNRCPLVCSCYNPAGWATQHSQMISLKEVTVRCLNGMNDEFKLLKVLLKLAPRLESVKLIVGPHFQCVRQKGKATNFLDVSKNVFQEIQILASLVPIGCTLEMYEHAYDNKSDDYALVPLQFDNEED